VLQQLPASRNPFTYHPKVIVSIDTLKLDRYRAHLERHRRDVVVIDESNNVSDPRNSGDVPVVAVSGLASSATTNTACG
jgi:hypothetical protein